MPAPTMEVGKCVQCGGVKRCTNKRSKVQPVRGVFVPHKCGRCQC